MFIFLTSTVFENNIVANFEKRLSCDETITLVFLFATLRFQVTVSQGRSWEKFKCQGVGLYVSL